MTERTRKYTIELDYEREQALRRVSARDGRSLTAVVLEAVDEYLRRHQGVVRPRGVRPGRSVTDGGWAEFDAALARIRAGLPGGVDPQEIEAEITAASAEAERERLARRQAD